MSPNTCWVAPYIVLAVFQVGPLLAVLPGTISNWLLSSLAFFSLPSKVCKYVCI
jgi:hypothetical protein